MARRALRGEIVARSAEELKNYGAELGKLVVGGTVIVLTGPLGAGKTTFVQGIARGMEVKTSVTSPTFALIHLHEAWPLTLVHCDLYRLQSEEELEQLGIWEYFALDYVVAIEWGQAFLAWLPENCVQIEILPREGERLLRLSGENTTALAKWVRKCQS